MKQLLIFDFDGLILDTETPDYLAWQKVFQEHGAELPMDVWARGVGAGSSVVDLYDALERQLNRTVARDRLTESRRSHFYDLLAKEHPRPGVEDYLVEAGCLGLQCAVASSADRAWVNGHLQRLGLIHHFKVVCTREDVAQAKPAPDLFLAALSACGIASDKAIVFEDSPNGLLAARRAGIYAVAVPNPVTIRLSLEADKVLNSLADLPLSELLAGFGRH
ncbi:MAG: haloacid dehalogenase [Candidatus Hydrogenedentota bacterium]